MAEFCKKCFIRIEGNKDEDKIVMSSSDDLCEGCGEVKPVVISIK